MRSIQPYSLPYDHTIVLFKFPHTFIKINYLEHLNKPNRTVKLVYAMHISENLSITNSWPFNFTMTFPSHLNEASISEHLANHNSIRQPDRTPENPNESKNQSLPQKPPHTVGLPNLIHEIRRDASPFIHTRASVQIKTAYNWWWWNNRRIWEKKKNFY